MKTSPDYIVRKGASVMGFVEAKDMDKSLKATLKARIHQADLWGSRVYKYNWLESHGLADTPWQALQPALPQLLLVPRDETDAAEYEQGWKVTDIFPVNSVGIVTARDSLTIHFTAESLTQTAERFSRLSVNKSHGICHAAGRMQQTKRRPGGG